MPSLDAYDLPGIHTKFIESHRTVLSELLDLVLPEAAIDKTKSGIAQFSARYGFADKPVRIRFRELDPRLGTVSGPACADIALDAESFNELTLEVKHVFITENEINFLTFPLVPDSIVVFGSGYGWDALGQARWLERCAIYYWGDIDTHGFAILSSLRRHFDNVLSFLMDRETFDAYAGSWGVEPMPTNVALERLTDEEQRLYDDLRYQRIRPHVCLRLEQEYIRYSRVKGALSQLLLKGIG